MFVIGGITRSEVRTAHTLSEQLGRDIVLGGTSMLTPASYLASLRVRHCVLVLAVCGSWRRLTCAAAQSLSGGRDRLALEVGGMNMY